MSVSAIFPFFLLLARFILHASAVPPPLSDLSITSTNRIAVYEDIPSQFRLVYSVSTCPQTVTFGEPIIDDRQVAVLALSSIDEDGALCTGPSPINFLGEENIRREDNLLENLQLGGMREALDNNLNAKQLLGTGTPPSLLLGWHDGERTCNANVYPRDTIYFIINENDGKTISLKKPTQREVVKIPPLMRALLIVAPSSKICLLVDTSSNADAGVTVTVVPDDGSPPTTTQAIPGESSPSPVPVTSTAAPAVPSPVASPATPIPASPAPTLVSSVGPESPAPSSGVAPVPGTAGPSTPTASPVAPVPSTTVPATTLAPSASPAGVGAVGPNETPGVVEATPSSEDIIIVEDSSAPNTDDGSACFPSGSTVTLESGVVKTMGKVEVGDRVLTDTGFSDVILFTHREGNSRSRFIRVTAEDGDSLLVSPGHYVYSNQRRLTAAGRLRKGDVLNKSNGEQVIITNIEEVSAVGLFNPQTECGSIVVNGFVTSTYTTAVDPILAHSVLMVPVRWIYRFSPRMAAVISSVFDRGSPSLAALLPKGFSVID